MCKIFVQGPGYTLPYEKLKNAVFNNWHSYGVVLKENGLLEVRKGCPPSDKGVDPEEVYKILKDNEDVERYIHLRHRTEGLVDMDNTQPFTVFSSKKRRIEFMHNGTLQAWKSENKPDDELKTASDTRRFAEMCLAPLLLRLKGEDGPADINDIMVQDILDKYWSNGANRGILISSDQDPYYFSHKSWTVVEHDAGHPFMASNDDYFDRVKRGPEHERMEAERRAREAEERSRSPTVVRTPIARTGSTQPIVKLQCSAFRSKFSLSEKIVNLLEDWDLYDKKGYVQLANFTAHEWENLVDKAPDDIPILLMRMSDELKQAIEGLSKEEDKNDKASKLIATLKKQKKEETAANVASI